MKAITVIFCLLGFSAVGFTATIQVPQDYANIQDAIDAASSGDTIMIAAGTYTEQLLIDGKDLVLEGAGQGQTYILSPATLAVTFTTSGDNKCVIGVINSGDLVLRDVTVDGQGLGNANYRFVGIGFRNSSGAIEECEIKDIQDTPFSGAQHGVGIYAYNDNGVDQAVDLLNLALTGYQKTGIALVGDNVIATVTGCSTAGAGQTSVTAQNGIQLAYGASGTVDGCTVADHCYTGSSWTATGILLYDASTVDVMNCPGISDNQTGAYYITTSGAFTNNTVTAGINAHGEGGYFYGLGIDRQGEHGPRASVFGEERRRISRDTTIVTVSQCTFDADQTGHGTGIGTWAMNGDNVEATILTCEITDWELGIDVWDDGTAVPTVRVFGCDIYGNTEYGIVNWTTSVVIAQYNWWGHVSGPYNLQWNPDGQGDNVSDLVWFWPWLENADYLTVPWDYPTIQAAIDAAASGDTIVVAPGDYEEQLLVDGKTVTIAGAGKGITHIVSPATLAVSFTTSADNKCIVGVINGGDLELSNVTIDGQGLGNANYRFVGVGYRNSGGSITDCEILDIMDTPFSGAQHGVGIYALNDNGVDHPIEITDCLLTGYQKTGMALSGDNVIATVTNCTTDGAGQTTVTAQNGIQLAYGASGTVDGCTVTGHCYTGSSWTATGILLYDADYVDVENCPEIRDNQTGAYFITTSGTFTNNTVTAGINAHGEGGYYYGVGIDDESPDRPQASVYGDGKKSKQRAGTTVAISQSVFTADKTGEGLGIGAWAAAGDPVVVDVTSSTIRDWALGIEVWDDGTALPTVTVYDCRIEGNDLYGGLDNTTTSLVMAEWNWWGHPTGPYNAAKNPFGKGNAVSDNVDFKPYQHLTAKEPETVVTLRVPADYPTIQEAIDAAQNGDIILVSAGDYEEQLLVDGKEVIIMGAYQGGTTILCPPILQTTFVTSADNKCIVGVINGANLELHGITVDGRGLGNDNYRFVGVGFRNAEGSLMHCKVLDIQDTPFSGAQHGVGIYAYNTDGVDRTIMLKKCELFGYQKTGIALNGDNVVAEVISCTAQGEGQTTVTAQNGIQLAYGASGSVKGCRASDHCYTGSGWTASGILLYEADTVNVMNCPAINDNQTGTYFVVTSGSFIKNTVTAGVNAHGSSGDYVGLGVDTHGTHGLPSKPFGEGSGGSNSNARTAVTVVGCDFTADHSGDGTGIGAWAQYGDDVALSIVDCQVRDWVIGVDVWDDGTATATVDITNSSITGNVDYGVLNWTADLVTAEYNWWGDPSGPYHATMNPGGLGDAVEGYVWIWNWLGSDPWN